MGGLGLELENKNIVFALTGCFYHIFNMLEPMEQIKKLGGNIIPVMSFNAFHLNTKLGNGEVFTRRIEEITNRKIICSIQEAEELGLHNSMDILVIAPASRKHHRKISKWYNRYPRFNGSKIYFAQQSQYCDWHCYK